MSTSAKADIRLKFANKKQVETLLDALVPEATAPVTRRANVKLQKDGIPCFEQLKLKTQLPYEQH
jgi:hypothetical protein